MPVVKTDDGCSLHVQVDGPDSAPAIMFSNSLGTTLGMWERQANELARRYRVIRYDRRGHGKSGVPAGPYSMERLGRDAIAIIDALGVAKTSWCGISMGGMVGQWLGANAGDRIAKLILSNTTAFSPDKQALNTRIKTAEEKGLAALADVTMERWFTKSFREKSPDAVAAVRDGFVKTPVQGFAACCAAIRDMDFRESNKRITVPTLVVVGAHDTSTPPAAGEAIHQAIAGSQLASVDAAHISSIENPRAYTETVARFLAA